MLELIDHSGDKNPILAQNCKGLTMQNISISNSTSDKEGILIENCNEVLIDGVSFLGNVENLSSAITYSISNDQVFENLRIKNVSAKRISKSGIIMEKKNNASLKNYLISDNLTLVSDLIQGENGRVINNF
ncbi:MAG: hypothetical protein ACJA2S_001503 [Cyclobacteriaceae bacterium]|jgi:hypothetical protein